MNTVYNIVPHTLEADNTMSKISLLTATLMALLLISGLIAPLYASNAISAGGTNLVAAEMGGRIVAFSSQAVDENGKVMPEWQVTNLIDGKHVLGNYTPADSYGWSSQHAPSEENPEWIVFAFAHDQTRLLRRIVIDPATDDPPFIGRWVRDIEVQVSTTTPEGPYKTVGRFLVVNKPIEQHFDFLPVEARYVRLVITSNHGSDKCVEMGEVEIYEAIVGDSALDDIIVRLDNLLQELKQLRDFQLYQQEQKTLEEVTTKPAPPASEKTAPEGTQEEQQ